MSAEIKSCLWCGRAFTQAKAPKAAQAYCSWGCHLLAWREGAL